MSQNKMQEEVKIAKARIGGSGRIVVDSCPYCLRTHYHNLPVGEGQRMADCFMGEYTLDFNTTQKGEQTDAHTD